ncbi:MAG: glycosyltransferase family 9 protein [Candidatus Cloacimonadota bacterium]|nr:glycosyltransferase family 9 protein [Candidatus Cloacimonadota bacterium]
MKKILIIHSFGMGDMIMALPMISQLKIEYPNSLIDLLILQNAAKLPLKNNKNINEIYSLSHKFSKLFQIIKKLRNNHYDVSITTSIAMKSNTVKLSLLSFFINAKQRVGEYHKVAFPFLYTDYNHFFQKKHRVISNMELLSLVSKKLYRIDKIPKIKINLDKTEIDFAERFFQDNLDAFKKTMIVHIGTSPQGEHRRWDLKKFENLIKLLKEKLSLEIIIIAGPAEIKISERLASQTGSLLVKNQPLGNIAALMNRADYFLNSDSGLGHVASAFDIKIFVIFGPGDENKTKPFNIGSTVISNNIPCRPCLYPPKNCDITCLKELSVIDVFNKIKLGV